VKFKKEKGTLMDSRESIRREIDESKKNMLTFGINLVWERIEQVPSAL